MKKRRDEREEDGGGRQTHRPLRIPHESAGKRTAGTERDREEEEEEEDAGRDEEEQSGAESITSVCVSVYV